MEKAAATASPTPSSQANYDLWQRVLDEIHVLHPDWTNARTPSREAWITLPFGASWAWYSLVVAGSSPRVELYFGSPEAEVNKREYERFAVRREDLEARFGGPIEFQPLPGPKSLQDRRHCPSPIRRTGPRSPR